MLRNLPRRAVVAFAARCARRVQPVITATWPDGLRELHDIIEKALVCTEQYGQGCDISPADAKAASDAYVFARDLARDLANEIIEIPADDYDYDPYVTITHAVRAVVWTVACLFQKGDAAYYAAVAAKHAANTFRSCSHVTDIRAIIEDLDRLLDRARQYGWSEDSKVNISPDFFRRLRPYGKPRRRPESKIKSKPAHEELSQTEHRGDKISVDEEPYPTLANLLDPPPINLYIDPGHASQETVQTVFDRLSNFHRAAGGLGLEFDTDGPHVYAREKVPT